ncbi:MAG: tRNA lysidine(34) synthetase TilS, partial [Flavobacteriaceae bacterium]|nr:tRNA lysidine(34) synthetase TilS [Flavobacteriaceae bacterium]
LKGYNFTEWNDIVDLLKAQTGKQVYSSTHRLLKDRDFLLLSEINLDVSSSAVEPFLINDNTSEITHPIHLNLLTVSESTSKEKNCVFLDKSKLVFPLILRKWQHGDFFYPVGMEGKKKLSNYFKDEKYSLLEKESTWLLCSGENILWIVGKRQDKRCLSNASTNSILKVSFIS